MSEDRPPPDVERGPHRELGERARALVDRARGTDREAAALERVERVLLDDARMRSWRRGTRTVAWGVAVVGTVGLGVMLGSWVGAGIAASLLLAVFTLQKTVERTARRRGASAWDWRARRYRLLGNPSRAVQDRDDPEAGERDPFGPDRKRR